ncbi:MAG: VIT domain-containing protein [Kofleriaceae bacterium]
MRIRHTLLGLLVACQTPSRPSESDKPAPQPSPKTTEVAQPIGVGKVVAVPLPLIAASSQQMPLEQVPAPWTLTASDGSGLLATRIEAKAVVQGPLAFTELHLHFANTEDRVREGTFAITLPQGAAVSRFAMKGDDGRWMEAEVVEKQMARRAYEDFLHRKQDPALMEKAEGNQFTARVFPIPAKGTKHLVVSFSQELPGARYTLPLRGLPKVERVDVSLDTTNIDGSRVQQALNERNWQPDRDFVSNAPATAEAISSGQLVVAQLSPFDASSVGADVPKSLTLLVDTSASRALGFARYANNLRELVQTMASKYQGVSIDVLAFDQDTQSIYSGPASGFGAAHVQALITRGAAGASDLSQALGKVGGNNAQRVVVITDGVFTAGAFGADLTAKLKAMAGTERVDVVLTGGIRDAAVAKSLVTAGMPRTGAVVDLDQSIGEVASAIGERVMSDVAISVEGASWVYPRVIESARPNQRIMVYARLDKPAQTMAVKIGGATRTVGTVGGTPALVERAAASAEIADLEDKLGDAKKPEESKKLKAEIATKSVAARVISSQTSMLVLESDGDYARYGIDRNALADILVVGPTGIEQTRRSSQIATTKPVPTKRKPPIATPEKPQLAMKDAEKNKAKEAEQGEAHKLEESKPSDSMDGDGRFDDLKKRDERDERDGYVGGGAETPPPAPPPPPRGPGPSTGAAAPSVDPAPREAPRPMPVTASDSVARVPNAERAVEELRADGNVRQYITADRDAPSSSGGESAQAWPPPNSPAPLKGELAQIDRLLKRKDIAGALTKAQAWHDKNPGDVLALIGMGEALEASKDLAKASRMYGSIIDLFPGRADLRRFAGERLERVAGLGGSTDARALAVDTYKRAVEERPDHLTGHRLLAYAQLRAGNHADAFASILAGIDREYPSGRFEGGERILREDAGLIGAAYAAAIPSKKAEIMAALKKRGLSLATGASTRFIMYWETDANDVDFHIQDAQGGHAWYSNKQLPSGGELYADVTTGYGPECFTIQGTPKAGPYKVSINYYSQGPMGYGMGLLQIVKHDGSGKLTFQDRPYMIMNDHAYVDLGTFK